MLHKLSLAIINMLKNIVEKVNKLYKHVGNFSKDIEPDMNSRNKNYDIRDKEFLRA